MKKIVLGSLAVFVAWFVLDFIIHGLLLGETYKATAELWRPQAEMKMGVMQVVRLIAAVTFTLIYVLVKPKSVGVGLKYGLLFGVAVGIGMGYGTYSVMPIPYSLAHSWFWASIGPSAVAGVIVGLILRDDPSRAPGAE